MSADRQPGQPELTHWFRWSSKLRPVKQAPSYLRAMKGDARRELEAIRLAPKEQRHTDQPVPVSGQGKHPLSPKEQLIKDHTYNDTWITRSKALNGMSYKEYLQSDEWRLVKQKASRHPHYQKCWFCQSTQRLEIHHRTYTWLNTKHFMSCLMAVCRDCHERVHQLSREQQVSVRIATKRLRKIMIKEGTWRPLTKTANAAPDQPAKSRLEQMMSPRGGWTKKALAQLGVPWPPPRGWKKKLEQTGVFK